MPNFCFGLGNQQFERDASPIVAAIFTNPRSHVKVRREVTRTLNRTHGNRSSRAGHIRGSPKKSLCAVLISMRRPVLAGKSSGFRSTPLP